MKKRLLSLVLCLVMIFSLVPFSAAAAGDDALYEEVTPADGRAWRTTDDYNFGENGEYVQLYAYVDEQYVPVDPVTFDTYNKADVPEGGWTAESANQVYNANPRTADKGQDQNLYYHAGGSQYYAVYVDYQTYYRNAGNPVPASNLCNSGLLDDWFYGYGVETPVAYYYTPENVSTQNPTWHRVYANLTGVNTVYKIGHYVDLWYYTQSETGSYVTGSGTYDSALNANPPIVARIERSRNETGLGGHGYYEAYLNNGTRLNKPTDDYIGGKLYVRVEYNKTNHVRFNEMHTESGQVLAWPLTQENSSAADSAVPGSSTYGGDLYYHDQGVSKLVRKDGTTLKDCEEKTGYDEAIYSGKLFVKLPDSTRYVLDVPQPTATVCPDQSTIHNPGTASDETGKVHLNKTLSQAAKDNYTLTLEGYATAGGTTIEKIKKTPTDFIVVVDESGSMNKSDIPASYSAVSPKTLEQVAAGNYYINVRGEYYRVFAKRGYLFEKFPSNTLWTNDIVKDSEEGLHWFQSNTTQSFSKANQYYIHEDGGAFRPVTVTVKGVVGTYYVKFFTYPGGVETEENKVFFERGSQPWYHSVTGGKIVPGDLLYGAVNGAVKTLYPDSQAYTYSTFVGIKTGMFINRDMYKRHVGYTGLYYRDMNGDEWPVITNGSTPQESTEYCNSKGEAVTTDGGSARMTYQGLYQAGQTMTRFEALKTALRDFSVAVAADTDDEGVVPNRVAVVGFSNYSQPDRLTTGLINASDANGNVNPALTAAINDIDVFYEGGTQPEVGLNEARTLLENRTAAEKQERNTVVIFFTDGQPGDYPYSDQYLEANDVVEAAKAIKDLTYGTAEEPEHPTIYSIGVFGESDGNPLLYPRDRYDLRTPKSVSKNNDYEYEGGFMEKISDNMGGYYYMKRQWRNDNVNYTETPNDTIFDYMSVVSSNYPNATTFIAQDWVDPNKTYGGNYVNATEDLRGAHSASNDYYRMASTQATLVAAFEEAITKTVEIHLADETTSVLDTGAQIRDKINVDLFDLEGHPATYTVKKVPVMAVVQEPVAEDGFENSYHWTVEYDDSRASEETVLKSGTVPATGIITASGLDYATEYVNRRHAGFKLVVEVTGLVPKQFNTDVATNYGTADIYPDGAAVPMVSVGSPIVNVYRAPKTATWKNWDGSTLETDSVPYGGVPEYLGETPTREPDENYTYTFSGWDPEVGPITEDTTYIAQYTAKEFESTTVVADFNSRIVIAEDSSSDNIQGVIHQGAGEKMNGTFAVDGAHNAYYQLDSGTINGGNTTGDTAVNLTPYSGSDFARIYGRHIDLETGFAADEAAWKKVTVYPATNIYFSDNTATVASNANNQVGFAEGVVPDSALNNGATTTGSRYFVVKGTRVDVYGTTSTESGTITAYLYTKNDDGELVRFKTKMVSMRSETGTHTRYDAPVVSFSETLDGMNPDTTYYLRVYAPAAAKLRLDGIRVYNADNNDVEKNAEYVNLRDVLLKADDALDLSDEMSAEGVVFFTDKGNLDANDHAIQDLDELIGQDDAYKKNIPIDYKNVGPKNEVYLSEGQAVGFQVKDGCKVMVSMRVPEGGNAQLQINGSTDLMFLDSSVDMYYPIQPNADGVVLIKNVTPKGDKVVEITEEEYNEHQGEDGYRYDTEVNKYFKVENNVDTFVSLMNVKITDSETAAPGGSRTLMASPKMLRFAVNPDVQTEEPAVETPAVESPTVETPEPTTQPSIISIISQLLSNFVNSLFGSISRLFGN